jgi:hypothetical protein
MKPIELQLLRDDFSQPGRTIGRLLYEWKDFAHVVEDTDRGLTQGQTLLEMVAPKVSGKTCIAAGYWPIVLQDSPKYGTDTLTVLVLGHQDIRIHPGNDEEDTEGCICPGLALNTEGTKTVKSVAAVAWLEEALVPFLKAGGEVWIRIERGPSWDPA